MLCNTRLPMDFLFASVVLKDLKAQLDCPFLIKKPYNDHSYNIKLFFLNNAVV